MRSREKLEPKFSTVVVRDASGKQVDKGDPHVDEVDPSLLKVSLPTLAAGRYKVEWRVTSVDTHCQQGRLRLSRRQIALSPPVPESERIGSMDDPLTWIRAVHFAATLALAGAVIFGAAIAGPALCASAR